MRALIAGVVVMLLGGCVVVERHPTRPPPPPPPPRYVPPPAPAPVAITREQAEQIAVRYALDHQFNVHKVKGSAFAGRTWEVRLQGHPPTPGKMRVFVDAYTGGISGAEAYRGEGHGHGHGRWDDDD